MARACATQFLTETVVGICLRSCDGEDCLVSAWGESGRKDSENICFALLCSGGVLALQAVAKVNTVAVQNAHRVTVLLAFEVVASFV